MDRRTFVGVSMLGLFGVRGEARAAADPVSWAALAAIVLTKAAEAFGQKVGDKLGEAVGQNILEGIGLAKRRTNEDLKVYFDQVAEHIVATLKEDRLHDNIRAQNANLKTAWENLVQYLNNRRDYRGRLEEASRLADQVFNQLGSMTGTHAVIVPLINAGALRLSVATLRYGNAKYKKAEARNAHLVGASLMRQISLRFPEVEKYYESRITLPYGTKTTITCYVGGESIDGPPRGAKPQAREVSAMAYKVDGVVVQTISSRDCDDKPAGEGKLLAEYNQSKAALNQEYQREFVTPYEQFKQAYNDLLSKIPKV